jgi:hypothetical protein
VGRWVTNIAHFFCPFLKKLVLNYGIIYNLAEEWKKSALKRGKAPNGTVCPTLDWHYFTTVYGTKTPHKQKRLKNSSVFLCGVFIFSYNAKQIHWIGDSYHYEITSLCEIKLHFCFAKTTPSFCFLEQICEGRYIINLKVVWIDLQSWIGFAMNWAIGLWIDCSAIMNCDTVACWPLTANG